MAYYRTLKSGERRLIYTAADKHKQALRRKINPDYPDQRTRQDRGIRGALHIAYYYDALEILRAINDTKRLIDKWRDNLNRIRTRTDYDTEYRIYIRNMIDALAEKLRTEQLALTIRTSDVYIPDRRHSPHCRDTWLKQAYLDVLRQYRRVFQSAQNLS
jgi:hypothetical protein